MSTAMTTAEYVEKGAAAPPSDGDATAYLKPHTRAIVGGVRDTQQITPKTRDESKRSEPKSSRINPDDFRFIRVITIGVIFAGLVAFLISFVALMEVAAWLGLPTWMHWGVPAFIDTAILVYAGSVLIHKARGEKSWPSWLMLGTFTVVSMVANTAHALSHSGSLDEHWQGFVGAGLAAMVPIAVFAATEQLARVAVEDPVTRRRELKADAEWAAQHAERERKQLEMEAQREKARQEAELADEEHRTRIEELRAQRDARAARAAKLAENGHSLNGTSDNTVHLSLVDDEVERPKPESKPAGGEISQDEVALYVVELISQGQRVSGGVLSKRFGFSDKTGRRRLADLRRDQPELFLNGGDQS